MLVRFDLHFRSVSVEAAINFSLWYLLLYGTSLYPRDSPSISDHLTGHNFLLDYGIFKWYRCKSSYIECMLSHFCGCVCILCLLMGTYILWNWIFFTHLLKFALALYSRSLGHCRPGNSCCLRTAADDTFAQRLCAEAWVITAPLIRLMNCKIIYRCRRTGTNFNPRVRTKKSCATWRAVDCT